MRVTCDNITLVYLTIFIECITYLLVFVIATDVYLRLACFIIVQPGLNWLVSFNRLGNSLF